MNRVALFGWALLAAFGISDVRADDAILGQLYGSGVHAYNRGDYVSAYRHLSAAIDGGTIDPRVYYFRGLALIRLGRGESAVEDFTRGAELEVGEASGVFPVNRSLERIQGRDRARLERLRKSVLVARVQEIEAARRARYEQRVSAERSVRREVRPENLPTTVPRELPVPSDPFADGGGSPAEPDEPRRLDRPDDDEAPQVQPTPGGVRGLIRGLVRGLPSESEPRNDASRDGAADGAFPGEFPGLEPPSAEAPDTPTAESPFGTAPSADPPTGTPPTTPVPAPMAEDPFGGPAPSQPAKDPFGGPAPSEPMTPTPPENENPPAPGDNPFGDPPPTQPQTPAPQAPANPFGDPGAPSTPAPQTPSDNPFGDPPPMNTSPEPDNSPQPDNPFGG